MEFKFVRPLEDKIKAAAVDAVQFDDMKKMKIEHPHYKYFLLLNHLIFAMKKSIGVKSPAPAKQAVENSSSSNSMTSTTSSVSTTKMVSSISIY